MSYQTLVQSDRIAFATQQGPTLNQIAVITTDIPSRSTIYFGPSNIFRQDGTIDETQAVLAIDVFNKTVRVGSTYFSTGGGIMESQLVSTTEALLSKSAGSGGPLSVLQLTSTVIGASATSAQLNNTLTSTVAGQFVSFSPALQAGLSTLGLFTSNTSNYYKNNLVNYSSPISTISSTILSMSNYFRGQSGDLSTPASTLSTTIGQTSNWSRGTLQNWSTPVSTVALFTSNTSNWAVNLNQNWSSAVSIATLYTSNTSNYYKNSVQDWSTPVSTVALFTSNTSNWAVNLNQNWSSAVSTATLFTSNTSNWSKNMMQDYSTAVSSVGAFTSNSSNYFMANAGGSGTSSLLGVISSGSSTLALFTSNTSNWSRGLLVDFSTPVSSISTASGLTSNWSKGLLQDYSTPVSSVSSVAGAASNYFTPLLANNYSTNLTSTVTGLTQGLGSAGYISTATFLSSMFGITSNISSMIDPVELASSVVGLGTVGFVSAIGLTAILNSTVVGVNTYVSSMIDPVELTSSIIGLGASGFISTVGLDTRLASTVFGVNSNMYSTTSGTSTQIANVYQFSRGFLQDFSTPVSSVSTVSGLTSNWSRNLLQDYSTPVSTVSTVSGLTSNWSRGLLQDYSTPISTVSTTAGQTSNWSRGLLQDYSTPVSTVFFYSRNLLQDFSTPVSSVALFTSNTSNYAKNILQDWSTPVNTVSLYTQNTSNWARGMLQDWSTPVSSVALFTSNTSNWASNIQQNWSSAVSVATLYTSNTSNWSRNLLQDYSTPVSSVAVYASNTSNWASNIQQNWSSALSIATLYTSNTSNWSRGLLQDYSTPVSTVFNYSRNLLQDFSTPVSSVALFTSNTSNWSRNLLQDYSTPVSTVFNYSRNLLQDFSTPVSSVALYTSNTSNWSKNMLQDYSTPVSTVFNYSHNILQDWSTPVSSVGLFTSNTSNYARNLLQDYSTPVSSVSTYTGVASNWSRGILQDWSTPVNTVTLYTQNTSNWAKGMLVDWSTPLSTATLFTSNTSNFLLPALSNNYSTNLQSTVVGLGTANYISASQLYSTVTGVIFNGSTNTLSSARIFTSSINVAFVTGTQGFISSLVVDSLAIGSNSGFINMGDIITTSHSTLQINTGLFTATGTVCTPQIIVSSINGQTLTQLATVPIQSTVVGLATAGYISSTQLASTQAYLLAVTSTGLSSVALFTSNTSNYARNLLQDYSTPVSTVSTVAGQSSNWSRNLLQDYSTPVSTVALFTSNTSNYSKNILQDWSTATQSTVAGLGTASYISAAQLYSTVAGVTFNGSTNTLSASRIFTSSLNASYVTTTQGYISSLVVDSLQLGFNNAFFEMGDVIATSLSTLQINTGVLAASGTVCTPQIVVSTINGQTLSQLATVPIQSTAIGLGTLGYISTAAFLSSMLGMTSNISSMIDPVELASSIVGLGTVGFVSSIGLTAIMNSTVAGVNFYVSSMIDPVELTSTITGLGASGFISTVGLDAKLASTVQGLGSATYISSAGFDAKLASTVQGLGSATYISSAGFDAKLASTVQGLGSATYISSAGFDAKLASTVQGLGSANYISATQLYSTVAGIGAMAGSTLGISTGTIGTRTIKSVSLSSVEGYISSFRTDSLTVGGPTGYVNIQDLNAGTISTGQLVAGAGFISSLQINTLSFGPSGYIIVSDVIANSLSTKKLNTQNLYANNVYVGNNSTQSAILFPGIDGTFKGTAIGEQTTGVGTEELLLYKVSTTTDQIRLQTTGNLVFEAGVSARSWPSTQMAATPTLFIQGSTSNVGIGTATPGTTLDVVGTGRFVTVSTLNVNLSTINGQTITQLIATPLQSTVAGLGTAGYVSTAHLLSTQAYLLAVTSTGLSSVALFTSNTSNYARNILQDWSTPILSTTAGLGTATYISAAQLYSTVTGVIFNGSTNTLSSARIFTSSLTAAFVTGSQGYISSLVVDSLAIGSNSGFINMGDIITTSHSSLQINTGILTASGTVCTPQIIVSSINGAIPLVAANITSSITGLGTVGYISSTQLLSTQAYLLAVTSTGLSSVALYTSNTSNWTRNLLQDYSTPVSTVFFYSRNLLQDYSTPVSTVFNYSKNLLQDYSTPVSTVFFYSRNLLQDFSTGNSTVSLFTSNTSNYAKGILQDFSTGISSVSIFTSNTSNYAKNILQDISTPVSSLSTLYGTRLTSLSAAISTLTLQNFTSLQGSVSSLQVNSLLIGTGTGSINLGDTVMTAVSSVSTATNTLYALNTLLGNVSSQTAIQFYGLTGQFNGTAIAEKLVSPGVQELLLYKASSIQDQIRLQTTGNIVFEAGVASRSWSTSTAAPTPTLYISYLSNVGIGTAAPATTLDVAGTGRFQTVSTLALITSSINGQTVAQLATLPIQSTVVGLGTAGYISSTQLASTQAYLLAVTSTGLSTVALFTSNTSNYARGFLVDFSTPVSSVALFTSNTSNWARGFLQDFSTPVSSVGLFTSNTSNYTRNLLQDWSTPVSSVALFTSNTSNYARNILQDFSTPLLSTTAGLGSASYISATQLYSTVAGITFSGSTNTLSASRIFTSSLNAAYVTATQGYISSLVVDSLQLGFNNAFFEMGDVIATSLSTLQVNTGILTTSGVICTPQIIVSTINGAAPVNPTNITSTVAGLGTSGYVSSFVPVYVSLSTAALFTSNTSNWSRNLLQDFSTPTTNTSNFFLPALSNNYSTNLTSTVTGLGTAGYISSATFLSSMLGLTSNISSMIDPVELASTVVGLGTIGFTSSIGLTAILNSTVAGVNTYVSSMIDPVELASSITSLGTQGFISTVGFDVKLASTTAGLGTATYISATQLYSTVAGITFSGSTNTLSSARIFTSSLAAAFVTGTQGFISSLVVDSLAIGSNSGFINMGDIITTSHSSLQINTGLFTASGTVCTPQIIVSSVNGAIPLVAANITSSIVGLGTAGYLSSVGPLYGVVSTGLSTVATFTSNTSNFFLPALSNNYSTNLQSTFAGLATGGYISTSQLFSTVTALTGSTLSLSTGSVFASSIQTLRLSTAQAVVCTVTFQDQLAGNPMGNIYQYSSVLYYNSFVVAGTTAMNIQSFTF